MSRQYCIGKQLQKSCHLTMSKGKKLVLQHCVPQRPRHGLSSSHNMRSLSICPVEIQEEIATIHPSAEGWGPANNKPGSFLHLEGSSQGASELFTTGKDANQILPALRTFQRLCIIILPSSPTGSSWWASEGFGRLCIEKHALNGRGQKEHCRSLQFSKNTTHTPTPRRISHDEESMLDLPRETKTQDKTVKDNRYGGGGKE